MSGMFGSLLAQASDWQAPVIDWHALAPELVLIVGINIVLGVDLWLDQSKKWMMATISGFVLLAAFVPVVTLAVVGSDVRSIQTRARKDGGYAHLRTTWRGVTRQCACCSSTSSVRSGSSATGCSREVPDCSSSPRSR